MSVIEIGQTGPDPRGTGSAGSLIARPEDSATAAGVPMVLSADVYEQVRAVYVSFCRELTPRLSALLRADVSITVSHFTEKTFADSVAGAAGSSCYALLYLNEDQHPVLLEIANSLALKVIEMTLGGLAESSALDRELTELETHILFQGLEPFAPSLESALRRVSGFSVRLDSVHTDPKGTRTFSGSDLLICTGFDLRIAGQPGCFTILQGLHAIGEMAGSAGAAPNETEREHPTIALSSLRDARVDAEVCLQVPEVAVMDLIGLQPGQVLRVDKRLTDPVLCSVNGVRKFRGRMARSGNRRAFVVESLTD